MHLATERAHPTLPSLMVAGSFMGSVGTFPVLLTPWSAGNGYGTLSKGKLLLRLRLSHASSDHW